MSAALTITHPPGFDAVLDRFFYVGHGAVIAGAIDQIRALSRDYQIPVATTVHALGTLPADDRLNLGMIGMHRTVVSNLAAFRVDVVLALGARFDDQVVSAQPTLFAPHARIIHVDVDPTQLNRVRQVSLAIHGDVSAVLTQLTAHLDDIAGPVSQSGRQSWLRGLPSASPTTNGRPLLLPPHPTESPPGASPLDLIWRETWPDSGEVIRVKDRYDFAAGNLRQAD